MRAFTEQPLHRRPAKSRPQNLVGFILGFISFAAILPFHLSQELKQEEDSSQVASEQECPGDQAGDHVYDVLVIGSGWSGLGAGTTLLEAGLDNFEILEARDYVGGRSRTIYPFTDDLAVELGSAWVYGGSIVDKIIDEQGIPHGETIYDFDKTFGLYQLGNFDGEPDKRVSGEVPIDERKELIQKVWWDDFVHFSKEKRESVVESENDIPYQTIMNDYIEQRHFAINSKSRQFVRAMVNAQIEVEYAASLEEVSTSDIGSTVSECVFCGADYYIAVKGGGFDKILAPLADQLKNKIQLKHIVTKIEYPDNQPARVTYRDARDGTTHTKMAERVLVTIPLGVLKAKSIEFVPSLPDWKQEAIDLIGFGNQNKCIFYWNKDEADEASMSWWPYGKQYMSLVTSSDATTGMWSTFFNDRDMGNGDEFVLSSWVGGDNARAIELLSDEAIKEHVLGNLRGMLGDNVPEPSKFVISRWGQDEFSRGSLSFYSLGGVALTDPAREKLAEAVGKRLFWAGEATSVSAYGTTHGAYDTGVEVAKKIHASLAETAAQ